MPKLIQQHLNGTDDIEIFNALDSKEIGYNESLNHGIYKHLDLITQDTLASLQKLSSVNGASYLGLDSNYHTIITGTEMQTASEQLDSYLIDHENRVSFLEQPPYGFVSNNGGDGTTTNASTYTALEWIPYGVYETTSGDIGFGSSNVDMSAIYTGTGDYNFAFKIYIFFYENTNPGFLLFNVFKNDTTPVLAADVKCENDVNTRGVILFGHTSLTTGDTLTVKTKSVSGAGTNMRVQRGSSILLRGYRN